MKIKNGQLVAITTGEWSDYCLRDHMRALKDFDATVEAERFKTEGDYLAPPSWLAQPWAKEWIRKGKSTAPVSAGSGERFLAWLIREKIMEPCDGVLELHIGSYDELSIDAD